MKKSAKILTASALAAVLSVGSFAAGSLIDITVDPTIKIRVNGEDFQPTDANGNPVMVFAYNGTTYAPLRALAEAYGLEVGYDAAANMATVDAPATNGLYYGDAESYDDYTWDEPDITVTNYDSSLTADMIRELEGIAFFWAPTGDKVHMDPHCRSFEKGYVFAGTLAEAQSVRTEGWCGWCADAAGYQTTTNSAATIDALEDCYSYYDYINRNPARAFE